MLSAPVLAMEFPLALLFTTLGMVFIAGLAGWVCTRKLPTETPPKKNILGILVDGRGRYSLNHFQVVMWTILIIGAWLAVLFVEGSDGAHIKISDELLGLIGVSLGSGALSGAVKAAKDPGGAVPRATAAALRAASDAAPVAPPQGVARVAVVGSPLLLASGALRDGGTLIRASLGQIIKQEEGDHADEVIDVSKFQNLIFTLVAGGMFVLLALKTQGLPASLSPNLIWLLGISHAGYVAAKVPNKA